MVSRRPEVARSSYLPAKGERREEGTWSEIGQERRAEPRQAGLGGLLEDRPSSWEKEKHLGASINAEMGSDWLFKVIVIFGTIRRESWKRQAQVLKVGVTAAFRSPSLRHGHTDKDGARRSRAVRDSVTPPRKSLSVPNRGGWRGRGESHR